MKAFIVFAAIVAVALAAPQHNPDAQATVITQENTNIGVGDFQSRYVFTSFIYY